MHLNPLSEILSPQYHPSIPGPFTFLGGLNILPVPSFESRHLYIQSQCQSSHRLEESTQACFTILQKEFCPKLLCVLNLVENFHKCQTAKPLYFDTHAEIVIAV